MSHASFKRIILAIVLVVICVSIGILSALYWNWLKNKFSEIIAFVLVIYNIFDWMYSKFPKVFWFFKEIKLLLINQQVRWKASADIQLNDISNLNENALNDIWKNILAQKSRPKCILHQDSRLIARVGGVEIEINQYYFDENPYFHIEILEYHAPFLDTSKIIDELILPIFDEIGKFFFGKTQENYSLEVFFENGKNPFVGMYANESRLHDLVSFNCVLRPKNGDVSLHESTVKIDKERVELITNSIVMFGSLARKYLTATGV